jgi:hypothetical protein
MFRFHNSIGFIFLMAKIGDKKSHAKKKQAFLRDLLRQNYQNATKAEQRSCQCRKNGAEYKNEDINTNVNTFENAFLPSY